MREINSLTGPFEKFEGLEKYYNTYQPVWSSRGLIQGPKFSLTSLGLPKGFIRHLHSVEPSGAWEGYMRAFSSFELAL